MASIRSRHWAGAPGRRSQGAPQRDAAPASGAPPMFNEILPMLPYMVTLVSLALAARKTG
jgi:hypothetical protein